MSICNSFYATAGAIDAVGAKIIFVDCDSRYQINIDQIEKKITKKTKAIMVVHLYGRPCNMKKILKIAKKRKLILLEDCAEAIGSTIGKKRVGSFSDISIFSFFGNTN